MSPRIRHCEAGGTPGPASRGRSPGRRLGPSRHDYIRVGRVGGCVWARTAACQVRSAGRECERDVGTDGQRWERRAWAAGIVFVAALLAETAISAGLPINQDDSATKIARQQQDHRHTVLVAAYLSAVYAVAFVIYLAKLHDLLRRGSPPPGALHSLVLIGGVLLVAFHGVSDIGIYGLLGGKIATYAAHHDQGLSYTSTS